MKTKELRLVLGYDGLWQTGGHEMCFCHTEFKQFLPKGWDNHPINPSQVVMTISDEPLPGPDIYCGTLLYYSDSESWDIVIGEQTYDLYESYALYAFLDEWTSDDRFEVWFKIRST